MFNRRAVSTVIVYLLLILIAIFSGLLVKYMAEAIIKNQIQSTLGLRLLLHSIALSYNAMYSVPSGLTSFGLTVPSSCEYKCIDCNSSIQLTPLPVRVVNCTCDDGLNVDELMGDTNLLGDTRPDKSALVCDDFIIENLNPVMIFVGNEPVGAAINAHVRIYPKTGLFWSFRDVLSTIIGDKLFNREMNIFTEMPLNLNDLLIVKSLLAYNGYNNVFSLNLNEESSVSLYRNSYDDFDSIVYLNNYFGLQGLASLAHSGGGSFYLKPGQKLVADGTSVCEFDCYSFNALDSSSVCEGGWHKVGCFDFSLMGFDSVDLCGSECAGSVSVDFSKFKFYDIVTGAPGTLTNLTIDSNSIDWPLSSDCSISAACDGDVFNLSVTSNPVTNPCSDEGWLDLGGGFCKLGYTVFGSNYVGCDSAGNYTFTLGPESQFIKLHDRVSTFFFSSILRDVSSEGSYVVTGYGPCGDDFKVTLEPLVNVTTSSKKGLSAGGVSYPVFTVTVNSGNLIVDDSEVLTIG